MWALAASWLAKPLHLLFLSRAVLIDSDEKLTPFCIRECRNRPRKAGWQSFNRLKVGEVTLLNREKLNYFSIRDWHSQNTVHR